MFCFTDSFKSDSETGEIYLIDNHSASFTLLIISIGHTAKHMLMYQYTGPINHMDFQLAWNFARVTTDAPVLRDIKYTLTCSLKTDGPQPRNNKQIK